ncbi:Uncharacterized protein FWK35_00024390 [Aphis craccivora]|uniref:Double jelly roll-like domain-containing protein n=1 Tax=Aphis craccivora TaxID=307492 RepID=A0A6G0VZ56_APHCR|nr:Uncharacterized protein FWK35_00024390 [Aphis craccivora]
MLADTQISFELKGNNNSLKCEMLCNVSIDLSMFNNISELLDVSAGYVNDCKITQIDYHSFLPYSTSALSNNDEVSIALHNTESYTLPCESYIYIEGAVTKPAELTDDIRFINNGMAFLFSEMKYELNGIQIQKLANPGITTTLKGYCSYNKSDIVSRYNAALDDDIKNVNKDVIESGMFNGCISLKDLFGFCEDYKRINAVKQYKNNDVVLDAPKLKDVKINITKILWRMPIVKVSDREKIRLLKIVNHQKPLNCAFRSWELCEYPFLPQNTSHSWKTDRKNSIPLRIISKATLLRTRWLHYTAHTPSSRNPTMVVIMSHLSIDILYILYTRSDFKKLSPIIIVDMRRQNGNVKTSTVDLRIEINTEEAFPASTSAYCLILHDQIINYNPFNVSRYNAAWDDDIKNFNKDFIESGMFNGCINLKDLFGFCEDYKRILINCNQQLILNRASIDINAVKQYKNNDVVLDAPKLKDVKINIMKILWRMPIVKVSDREKIQLLKIVNHQKPLKCAFRSWELCEYPFLPQNTLHSWKTDRKNSMSKSLSCFDHCKIKNLKVYLNSEVFPYEDFQSDFTMNKMASLYRAYAEFQKSYYGRDNVTPLLTRMDFKKLSPIVAVDMSRQNDNVNTSTVDLRIEIDTEEAFPVSTSAYCLILHDQIITYNPFNGETLLFFFILFMIILETPHTSLGLHLIQFIC